jgi:hypothetical protein
MKKYSKLCFAVIFGVLATRAVAEPSACKECDLQSQENLHREQIKADRAKYDLENDKAQEGSRREQIKADRAKYDRENDNARESSHREQIKVDRANDLETEKLAARPWDVVKDNKPLPAKIN